MIETSSNMIADPGVLEIAVLFGLVLFSFLAYRRTWPPSSAPKRILLATIRSLGFLFLLAFIINPAFVSVKRTARRPVIPVLLDVSRSMEIIDPGGGTRLDAARETASELIDRLPDADVVIIPFASEPVGYYDSPDSILEAAGEGTDIFGSLQSVFSRFQGSNMSSAVLLSDGRITRGMKRGSDRIPVEIYSIGFGDSIEGADYRIEDISYDREAVTGTRSPIKVEITGNAMDGDMILVELIEEEKVLDRVEIESKGKSPVIDATLNYTPENEGDHMLTVRVVPFDGEKIVENNTETLRILVSKDRIRILYIDQFADWNISFIKNMTEQSERLEAEVVTWRPDRGYHSLGERDGYDLARVFDAGESFDVIILGDDNILFDLQANRERLTRFINTGGGVIFLASEASPLTDSTFLREMARVLPVRSKGSVRVSTGEYHLHVPTSAGSSQLGDMMERSGGIDMLPPFPAMISGLEANASAEVPLEIAGAGEGIPALVIGRSGDGVAAVFLPFPLWRWKLAGKDGLAAYTTLIQGLIEYISGGIDTPLLRLQTDRSVYRTGEKPEITALIRKGTLVENIRGEIFAGSEAGETPLATFLFSPRRGERDLFSAVLDPLPPGEYLINATGDIRSGESVEARSRLFIESVSVELLRTSQDSDMLRELALLSGGKVIGRDDIEELLSLLKLEEDEVERRLLKPARSSAILFMLILACFTAEWIIRKRWGMI